MGNAVSLPFRLLHWTTTYYRGLFYYLIGGGRTSAYEQVERRFGPLIPEHEHDVFRQHARIHLFSLASNFYLYKKPHYRKGSYRDDLIDNLRNVAIPGTGIP